MQTSIQSEIPPKNTPLDINGCEPIFKASVSKDLVYPNGKVLRAKKIETCSGSGTYSGINCVEFLVIDDPNIEMIFCPRGGKEGRLPKEQIPSDDIQKRSTDRAI